MAKPNAATPHGDWKARWFWLVLVLALGFIALVHDDFGVGWDDSGQANYGDAVLDYFASGFTDHRYQSCDDFFFYGPGFELPAALICRVLPGNKYEIRHVLIALTALLTVAGLMKLAGLYGGRWALVFATLALVMTPRFVGHAFINSKDIPFACCFTWAMYALALLFREKGASRGRALLAGLAVGAALSIRAGGFLLLCFLAAGAFFHGLSQGAGQGLGWRERLRPGVRTLGAGLIILVSAWGVMVLFWPWAQESPILNPIKAFVLSNRFHRPYPVLFMGEMLSSGRLPWFYLPWFLLITTPLAVLALALAGAGKALAALARPKAKENRTLLFLLLLWFFFPIAYVAATRPPLYDGIRHFLFLLPALALLAGMGAEGILAFIPGTCKKLAAACLAACLMLPAVDMVRLHPYEMTYFNSMVGKLEGACGKYETDYWLLSYKEGVLWLNGRTSPEQGQVLVLMAMEPASSDWMRCYAASNIEPVFADDRPESPQMPDVLDYYMGSTRYGTDQVFPDEPVVHSIGRDGAVFAVIKANR